MSKIIDLDRKGNLVRFYLGADNCTDYWGDDWNDAPYDCNAGTVYDEYVKAVIDIAFPFDSLVLEPSSNWEGSNRNWSKEDMKNRCVPCLIVVPKELTDKFYITSFDHWVVFDKVKRIYFGDPEEVLHNDYI